jgi:hypothetical protein
MDRRRAAATLALAVLPLAPVAAQAQALPPHLLILLAPPGAQTPGRPVTPAVPAPGLLPPPPEPAGAAAPAGGLTREQTTVYCHPGHRLSHVVACPR